MSVTHAFGALNLPTYFDLAKAGCCGILIFIVSHGEYRHWAQLKTVSKVPNYISRKKKSYTPLHTQTRGIWESAKKKLAFSWRETLGRRRWGNPEKSNGTQQSDVHASLLPWSSMQHNTPCRKIDDVAQDRVFATQMLSPHDAAEGNTGWHAYDIKRWESIIIYY